MGVVDETDQRFAQQLLFRITQQMLGRFIAALHHSIGGSHQHGVAQAVENGVQIVLGDRGFVELLPHALQRKLQVAQFVVTYHGQRPGVIALADAIRAFNERGNGAGQLPCDVPGAEQTEQHQRYRDDRECSADTLGLHALFALQLSVDAGQGFLHLGPAHPYL
jgi:hypothetical protein